jgi:hypothetical protein
MSVGTIRLGPPSLAFPAARILSQCAPVIDMNGTGSSASP